VVAAIAVPRPARQAGVNESTRQVEVHSKQHVEVLSEGDELNWWRRDPGFKCLVSEIFADLPIEK
jgi:hypothetical protein